MEGSKPAAPAAISFDQQVFDEAPVPCHELNRDGRLVRVNQAECRVLGYSSGEMIGQPVWQFIAGEESQAAQTALRRKLSGEQPLRPFLRQYSTRDGRYITFEIHEQLLPGPDGTAAGIRSALIDVTQRVAAERAQHESERWLLTTLASLRDGVIAVDAVGLVKFLNPVAERLTGVSQERAAGTDIDEVVRVANFEAPPEHCPASLGTLLSTSLAKPWQIGAVLRGRQGAETRVEINSSPITCDDRVIGVVYTLRLLESQPQSWNPAIDGPEPR